MCSSLGMKNFKYIAFWHGWLPHRSKNVLLAWGLEPRVSTAPQESAQVPGRAAWPLTEHHSYFCESVTKRGRQEGERMGCGRHTDARSMIFQLQDFTYRKQMLQVPARAAPVKQERQERTDPHTLQPASPVPARLAADAGPKRGPPGYCVLTARLF